MLYSDLPRLLPSDYSATNELKREVLRAVSFARMYPSSYAAIKSFFDGVTAALDVATPVPPVSTAAPAITGTAQVGQVLTVSNGTWTGTPTPTYTYQWFVGGTAVSGATASTYTPAVGDIGKTVTCTVRATNSAGSAARTSAATAAVIAA